MEKDKAELTTAIETNLEDTTKAVVMLRKELNDAIGKEKEQRKTMETQLKTNLENLEVGKSLKLFGEASSVELALLGDLVMKNYQNSYRI